MTAVAILDLGKVGFTDEHVRALANFLDAQAATKTDLRELELRLTIRFGGMMTAGVAITVALVKLLPGPG